MSMVTEYDWESDTWTRNGDTSARQAWRQAIADIVAKAHDKLPESAGRIDKAAAIALAGDVELLEGGGARVASQSNGTTTYHVVNGHCDCRDFDKAPGQLCKHRLAYGIREHSVILTFPVAALGTVQTPDSGSRYTWHSGVLTCDYCSPHTTRPRSA